MNRAAVGSLVFVALVTSACYTMTPLTYEDVTLQRPVRVWVTRADQSVIELNGPQVFNDTLVGYIGGAFHEMPTDEISRVAVKRPAKGKTMALVAAGIVGAAALGVMISGLGDESPVSEVDCNDVPDDPRCQGMGP